MKKRIVAIVTAAVVLVILTVYFGIYGGNTKVPFETVTDKTMPRELEADIIPLYRDTERALACKVEDEFYVLAMRGEKPTSGYEIQITELELESRDDKSNLIVYATFADPGTPETMAQVKSYPMSVVKADLNGLPDTIELRSEFISD
ncbi:MAG: protease complex subunit PrcB family protein [Firmicutes bacterium]|nr:protease complex subunit PrcB family protein [Bacillota bacterium]